MNDANAAPRPTCSKTQIKPLVVCSMTRNSSTVDVVYQSSPCSEERLSPGDVSQLLDPREPGSSTAAG